LLIATLLCWRQRNTRNEVWEHAYYLQHENRRAEYLKGWWSVANWKEAGNRLARAGLDAEMPGKGNGAELLAVTN